MSIMRPDLLDALTFIEMTLKLVEVALLQTNLQFDDMVCRCWTDTVPLSRNWMSFLDCEWRANSKGVSSSNASKESCDPN